MTVPDETPSTQHPFRWARIVALCGVLLALLGWLGGSESGLRALCWGGAQLSAGRLRIEAPRGRLLGDWTAQSVRWHDEVLEVEAQQLAVVWLPQALLHRQLVVEHVEAAILRIFSAPTPEPLKLPDSLQLPLSVRVAHLVLGRVMLGKTDEDATTLAEAIDATLDSNGQTHRLEHLQAQLGQLAITGDATLAAEQPFALKAKAALSGSALGQPFVLTLLSEGPLELLPVEGKIVSHTTVAAPESVPSGELHALVTPFATHPLSALRLQLRNVDPSVFAKEAPRALLDVAAVLERQGETVASGSLNVINRQSSAWDKQLVPIESLQAQLDWQNERLAFDKVVIELAGAGRLKGQGVFAGGQLALDLAASGVDARALDGRLLPTRLAGSLRAQLGGDRQTFEVDLRDAQYAVNAQASLTPEAVELSRLQLSRGEARLDTQGRLALSGERRFSAKGSVQNFDPTRFLQTKDAVRGVINAGFDATGALNPALELALHFDLQNSRIGAQALAGKGEIDLLGSRVRKLDVNVEGAGNRLSAVGAFGKAGDALRIKVLAPRLETLGWPGLSGDMKADMVIGGSVANPELSGELQMTRLHYANLIELSGFSVTAQLASGAQGKVAGVLRCSACALPDLGIPSLVLDLKADGLRNQHHLAGTVGLPEKRELRLALDGGIQQSSARKSGASPVLFWGGTLSELYVSSSRTHAASPLLYLVAPTPLRLSRSDIALGPATFEGLIGRLQVEHLGLEQGRWQSSGRWQQFRPRAVAGEFPSFFAQFDVFSNANPQPLVLAGEWNIALDRQATARPVGHAEIWRESGDVVLGKLSLGLSEARLKATVGQGRVSVSGQLRGRD